MESSAPTYEKAYLRFVLAEAKWLDETVREYLPRWIVPVGLYLDRHRHLRPLGRLFHLFLDYVVISGLLRISVTRQQHQSLLGGKGYRRGFQQVRLDSISTQVSRRGQEVAKQSFPMGVIIG